jgi:hypothetical protein
LVGHYSPSYNGTFVSARSLTVCESDLGDARGVVACSTPLEVWNKPRCAKLGDRDTPRRGD